MKAASSCRMAEVPHALRFTQHLRPRHFVQMILERHWMGNKLQAFIQATIRLYIQIFTISIGDVQQLLRVAVDRAAVIDFELNAEMPKAFAVEHEVGRVAVLVDDLAVLVPAGRAVSVVVTVPICAVAVNNAVAVLAADVILIETVVAQRVRIVLDSVFPVDPLSTVIADYGQAIRAVLAEPVTFHFKHIFNRVLCTAVYTNSCFAHCLFLHFVW